jgi:hypothetical protein
VELKQQFNQEQLNQKAFQAIFTGVRAIVHRKQQVIPAFFVSVLSLL